jgi:hypothetical protein
MELFALSTQDPTVRLPEPPKPSQAAAMMAARGAAGQSVGAPGRQAGRQLKPWSGGLSPMLW